MDYGFKETIENKLSNNGPREIMITTGGTWQNLSLIGKYRLSDLQVVASQNMPVNPWATLTGYNVAFRYETCQIRKLPSDGALVYAITANFNIAPAKSSDGYGTNPLDGSNFQWGFYGGNKCIFCRPCCAVQNICVYAFAWQEVRRGACGLNIYNDDGTIRYSSNHKYMRVVNTYSLSADSQNIIKRDNNLAVTMPFTNFGFRGNSSYYSDLKFFIGNMYPNTSGAVFGVAIGRQDLMLADNYYISPAYSVIDVTNF